MIVRQVSVNGSQIIGSHGNVKIILFYIPTSYSHAQYRNGTLSYTSNSEDLLFSSPGGRPSELMPSIGIRRRHCRRRGQILQSLLL